MERSAVETIVGVLTGRDAIYLDELTHRDAPSTVRVSGEFNTTLCSAYQGPTGKWVEFELTFHRVAAFRGWELDVYPGRPGACSSFDLIDGSGWATELQVAGVHHYVLSTYDSVYEVLATGFELRLGSVREPAGITKTAGRL